MSAAHHAQRLDRLRTFLRTNPAGLAEADAFALVAAIDRYFVQRVSLDEALGLRLDRGENHPGVTLAIAVRDGELLAAAAMLGAPCRANSEILAARLARYESGAWRSERTLTACPANRVGRIEGHLWRALKSIPRPIKGSKIAEVLAAQVEMKSAFEFQGSNSYPNGQNSTKATSCKLPPKK